MGFWKYIFLLLILILTSVWLAVFGTSKKDELHLIACDVGQGDAILATYNDVQILFDGGPNTSVLDCLSEHIPYWDNEIELIVLSHPQSDHLRGLIDVFDNYQVVNFLASSLDSSSQEYQVLKSKVGGSGARVINPTTGMTIRLGKIYLDIVWPNDEFQEKEALVSKEGSVLGGYTTKRDSNDFSVVAILRLEEFDALLTGDIGPKVIDEILQTGEIADVEYIKVPHHGSKNGLTKELLEASTPEIAVISVGKNQWGHPHGEVTELLNDKDIKTFRTDEMGNVEIITDGERVWLGE